MRVSLISALTALCLVSCGSGSGKIDPDVFPSTGGSVTGGGTEAEKPAQEKPAYIWIDAAANFPEFANSKENIERDLSKAKDCGFTDIVVDVRPTMGDVLFKTSKIDQVRHLAAWLPGGYAFVERTADWDYLQAFIDAGHKLGLRVHAACNTMAASHQYPGSMGAEGLLFRDSSKKSWATVENLEGGLANVMDESSISTKFFNPANPDVQDFLLGLFADLAAYKDLDGIFLDRGRYDDFTSDFSDLSRKQFEKYIGKSVDNWPGDVVAPGTTELAWTSSLPILTKQWIEYRASVIREFMRKVRDKVKAVNPNIKFGVYVGAWYDSYYEVGVNWASPKYRPTNFWATGTYSKTGFADLMDQMLMGAYASPGKVHGSEEWTIEGFCSQAKKKILDACPLVAGGPDVGNWDESDQYSEAQENAAITASVEVCMKHVNGYFLFDMCHLRSGDKWRYVKAGLAPYRK